MPVARLCPHPHTLQCLCGIAVIQQLLNMQLPGSCEKLGLAASVHPEHLRQIEHRLARC